ncbi:uncharacterized protein METZ01_LOCUS300596, partial [marine metagenome]
MFQALVTVKFASLDIDHPRVNLGFVAQLVRALR